MNYTIHEYDCFNVHLDKKYSYTNINDKLICTVCNINHATSIVAHPTNSLYGVEYNEKCDICSMITTTTSIGAVSASYCCLPYKISIIKKYDNPTLDKAWNNELNKDNQLHYDIFDFAILACDTCCFNYRLHFPIQFSKLNCACGEIGECVSNCGKIKCEKCYKRNNHACVALKLLPSILASQLIL